MKTIFIVLSLIMSNHLFAQEEKETTAAPGFTGTNIMGSGSKSAKGPAVNDDDTKYKNMDPKDIKQGQEEDPTTTDAIKGKTSIKVE